MSLEMLEKNETNPNVYVPIYERGHFIPDHTALNNVYRGDGALPYFTLKDDCIDWCKLTNQEIKTQQINQVENKLSLEEKLLNFQIKMHGVKLTARERECVISAMMELTLQRKLGNWTNSAV